MATLDRKDQFAWTLSRGTYRCYYAVDFCFAFRFSFLIFPAASESETARRCGVWTCAGGDPITRRGGSGGPSMLRGGARDSMATNSSRTGGLVVYLYFVFTFFFPFYSVPRSLYFTSTLPAIDKSTKEQKLKGLRWSEKMAEGLSGMK